MCLRSEEGVEDSGRIISVVDTAVMGSYQFEANKSEGFVHVDLFGQAMFDPEQCLDVDMS